MSSPEPSPPVTNTTAPSPNSSSLPAPASISPPQSTPSAPAPSSPPPTPPSTTALTVSPPPTPTTVTSPALSTSSPPPTSSAPPPSSSSTTVSRSPPPPSSSSANSPSPRPPSRSISSPPSSLSSSSSSGMSTRAVVGIAVGTVVILVAWSLLCIYCTRKKRRRGQYGAGKQYVPPPPEPKDGYNGALAQSWQQNNPPPAENVMPNPSFPPAAPPRPPHSPKHSQTPPLPSFLSSSGGSVSNYSGSEIPLPPTSPGMALGFSKSTFTYEELAMATDGFSDANLLGKGGFGYVHKGIFPNGKQVAVKSLKAGSGQGEPEFQAEVEIISRVHHKHLVSLVGYCMSGSQRMLVYEFVPNNTLEFHLHGKGQPTMDWPTRVKIAIGAAKGLAYLHEDCHPKIIHCDIKASNILLDFNFEAKLADFGLAKFSSDANTLISTGVVGTFGYLAPEYASSGKLTDKSDVFSFGVVLMELVTGRQPVDTTQTFMEDSLVDWARPLLTRALEDETFESLVDPCLQNEYNHSDMVRMVACAASCVRHSARRRPRMNQIVRALEGDMSLSDLSGGIRPGHSTLYGSYGSSDYDSNQYKEDMKGFRKMALASQDFGSGSDHGGTIGEPSGLSSQGQTAQRGGDGKDEERQPRFQRNILQMMLRPSVSGKNAAPSD